MSEYRYLILRHQPSLFGDEKENFAVLVEGRLGKGKVVFAVGRSPEPPSQVSDVAKAIIGRFPEVLADVVREAVDTQSGREDVLDSIHGNLTWNFFATKPEKLETQGEEPIYAVAFKLFAEHVAGADVLLDSLLTASKRMIRPPDAQQRLGETFQAAVPVPEPTFATA